jgi:hypothetical protein
MLGVTRFRVPGITWGGDAMSSGQAETGDGNGVWGNLFLAALFVGVAFWLDGKLEQLETDGGSIKLHWTLALAYEYGGRWGAIGLCGLCAVLFLVSGVNQALKPEPPKAQASAPDPFAVPPAAGSPLPESYPPAQVVRDPHARSL